MSAIELGESVLRWVRNPEYINREFSWLQFNRRVLAEAEDPSNPLFERLKFLAIFESNLAEFFMVRVSGLFEQFANGITDLSPDGLSPTQQIELVARAAMPMRRHAGSVWLRQLKPALAKEGIVFKRYRQLGGSARKSLEAYFMREVFPLCTPLMLQPTATFPFISNLSLNLAVELRDEGNAKLARVKIPPVLPRLVPIPGKKYQFILLEDLVAHQLHHLFPGVEVTGSHVFRVVRDADIEIRQIEAADLLTAVEQSLRQRRFGDPVLLEVNPTSDKAWLEVLRTGLELDPTDVYETSGLLGLDLMWEIAGLEKPGAKFEAHRPFVHERMANAKDLFATIREQDVLMHHPYDSFRGVEEFVASAVKDPQVIGIKQTLYRVGAESPIVESLLAAAEQGKQVAAMVELKARFDESNNIVWARALERAGVHVTYGFPEMKTHCKLCLIVRREADGIHTYAHIGSGNYNPSTARIYTDFGLFTADPEVCQDVSDLFNYLTGLSHHKLYQRLLVAPLDLRDQVIARVHREIESFQRTGRGRILFKLNSLVDPETIDSLYDASRAGVPVDLIVRGICCLRPGVPNQSETVRVSSIVGRFPEHSRAFYFENGGDPELFIGSADMMRRNLERRIEALVPIRDPDHIAYLRDVVLGACLKDNRNAWELQPSALYSKACPDAEAEPLRSQIYLMSHPATALLPPIPRLASAGS